MAKEIERKFLVKGDFRALVQRAERIVQGYLCSMPERTVRVRIQGERGILTIKGRSNDSGVTRSEFEYEIPLSEAQELMTLCLSGVIEKVRHWVPFHGQVWEVDVFHGDNEGLIIAEIELSDENEGFECPEWAGEEVTGQMRYYNALLSRYPYKRWSLEEKSNI